MRSYWLVVIIFGVAAVWQGSKATAQVIDTMVCGIDTISLSFTGYNGTVQWQSSTDGATWSNMIGETNDTLKKATLSEIYYRVEVTNGTCALYYPDTIHVIVIDTIDKATAGPDQVTGIYATLEANSPITGTGLWTISSGSGGSFADSSIATTVFTGAAYGTTYELVWEITTICGVTSDTVTITFVDPCLGVPSFVHQGETYNTISLGNQCWMKENMRTITYPDGSPITKGPVPHNDNGWVNNNGYYSCPPNTSNNGEDCAAAATLGMMYQWKAAMNNSITEGTQGICATGWHIPTDAEWMIFEGHLGMPASVQILFSWRGTNEGSQMANDLPPDNWTSSLLTGDPAFGSSGFDIGPSGYRSNVGNYTNRGKNSYMWTSTQTTNPYSRYFYYLSTEISRSGILRANALCVRCLKDN